MKFLCVERVKVEIENCRGQQGTGPLSVASMTPQSLKVTGVCNTTFKNTYYSIYNIFY